MVQYSERMIFKAVSRQQIFDKCHFVHVQNCLVFRINFLFHVHRLENLKFNPKRMTNNLVLFTGFKTFSNFLKQESYTLQEFETKIHHKKTRLL